jgi:hypothetical protein
MKKIDQAFADSINKRFAKKQNEMPRQAGVMGGTDKRLKVPGREGHVYVTIADKTIPVFCGNIVGFDIGTKVWVGYASVESTLYQVLSIRSDTPNGNTSTQFNSAYHAKRHEWLAKNGGQDPLHTHLRAISFMKIGVSPNGGMNVDLFGGWLDTGSAWIHVNRQDVDVSGHIPTTTGKAALVLITIASNGAVIQTKGAEFDIADIAGSLLPYKPDDTIFVCGAVRVYYGQAAVQEMHTNTDFTDLRFAGINQGMANSGSGALGFAVDGALAVVDNATSPILVTADLTIASWMMYIRDSGTSGSTILDVILNRVGDAPVSIFDNGVTDNRPVLAWNDADGRVTATPLITDFLAGDVLELNIEGIAAGASDVVLVPVGGGGGGGSVLNVKEFDGSPSVTSVSTIELDGLVVTQISAGVAKARIAHDITWWPVLQPSANTNWSTITNTSVGQIYIISSGAQNASLEWNVFLPEGTYDFNFLTLKSTDLGKYHLLIDGSDVETIDGYGSLSYLIMNFSGHAIISGIHTIKLKMSDKNASSSSYKGILFDGWARRTGD